MIWTSMATPAMPASRSDCSPARATSCRQAYVAAAVSTATWPGCSAIDVTLEPVTTVPPAAATSWASFRATAG